MILKEVISILMGIMTGIAVQAQNPDWVWAKSANGSGNDQSNCISADAHGNSYIAGIFGGASITFGSDTLTGQGTGNVFVAKYGASGNVIWARAASETGHDVATGVSADHSGNVFVSGYFGSPSISFDTTHLTNAGYDNIFIVKYDSSGHVIWAQGASGTGNDHSYGVSTDAAGNAYITGSFASPVIAFGADSILNLGGNNIFIAKYGPSGNVLWATGIPGGSGNSVGAAICTDDFGHVYVTGYFGGTVIIGADTLTSAGLYNVFVAKYSQSGAALWAKSAGSRSLDFGTAIATDGDGNVLVTGGFSSSYMAFDGDTLTNTGAENVFVVKYDSSGQVLWANSAAGAGSDYGAGVGTDAGGNVYVSGNFDSALIAFGTDTISNSGSNNIFAVKYDPSGALLWVVNPGCTGFSQVSGISTDGSGFTYITGYFDSSAMAFGADTLYNSHTLTYIGNVFTAKLSGTPAGVRTVATESIRVYPNPGTGLVYFDGLQNGYTVSVCNVLGEMSNTKLTTKGIYSLDMSRLPRGIYFFKVTDSTSTLVRQGKIIID